MGQRRVSEEFLKIGSGPVELDRLLFCLSRDFLNGYKEIEKERVLMMKEVEEEERVVYSPCIILGPPGIGKTSMMFQMAKSLAKALGKSFVYVRALEKNLNLYDAVFNPENAGKFFLFHDVNLASEDITDLAILSREYYTTESGRKGEKLTIRPLDTLRAFTLHPGVLFIDEITNIKTQEGLNFALKLLEGKLKDYPLHPYVLVTAAGNRSIDSFLAEDALPAPIRDRVYMYEVVPPTVNSWMAYVKKKYPKFPAYFLDIIRRIAEDARERFIKGIDLEGQSYSVFTSYRSLDRFLKRVYADLFEREVNKYYEKYQLDSPDKELNEIAEGMVKERLSLYIVCHWASAKGMDERDRAKLLKELEMIGRIEEVLNDPNAKLTMAEKALMALYLGETLKYRMKKEESSDVYLMNLDEKKAILLFNKICGAKGVNSMVFEYFMAGLGLYKSDLKIKDVIDTVNYLAELYVNDKNSKLEYPFEEFNKNLAKWTENLGEQITSFVENYKESFKILYGKDAVFDRVLDVAKERFDEAFNNFLENVEWSMLHIGISLDNNLQLGEEIKQKLRKIIEHGAEQEFGDIVKHVARVQLKEKFSNEEWEKFVKILDSYVDGLKTELGLKEKKKIEKESEIEKVKGQRRLIEDLQLR